MAILVEVEVEEGVLVETAWPLVLRLLHDVLEHHLLLVFWLHHHQLAQQLLIVPDLEGVQLGLDLGVVGLLELLGVVVEDDSFGMQTLLFLQQRERDLILAGYLDELFD